MSDSGSLLEAWDQYHIHELQERRASPFRGQTSLAFDLAKHERLYTELKSLSKTPRPKGWFPGSKQRHKIWFPGCGLSIGPILFATLGHEVWASDFSSIAIEYQQSRLPIHTAVADLLAGFKAVRLGLGPSLRAFLEAAAREGRKHAGVLYLATHDFCTPFPEGGFDCVLNVRSFQILPQERLPQAASVHWEALRPGGRAYFDTVNVGDGEWRQAIEGALATAGFHVKRNAAEDVSALDKQIKVGSVLYGMG